MALITLSREFGSWGEEIARVTAEKLDFLLINKKIIEKELSPSPENHDQMELEEKALGKNEHQSLLRKERIFSLHRYLNQLSEENNLVILGRGGHLLFKDYCPALHVKIICPLEKRILRVMELYSLGKKAAHTLISEQDRDRKKYIKDIFNENWLNLNLYDLVINTDKISVNRAAEIIVNSFIIMEKSNDLTTAPQEELPKANLVLSSPEKSKEIRFMHPSEEEFAKMLDFYRINWKYEPRTFPLEWDSEGSITEAFAPDFYLPDHDLYVEITTQRQKLVWKKNKKARRLKELYPDVNLKIIYNKDYKSLLTKFGLDN